VALSIETDFRVLSSEVQSMFKNAYVNNLGRFYAIAVRLYKQNGIRNLALNFLNYTEPDDIYGEANLRFATDVAAKLPVVAKTETYTTPSGLVNYSRVDETRKQYGMEDNFVIIQDVNKLEELSIRVHGLS
jgi:hypothetical protein